MPATKLEFTVLHLVSAWWDRKLLGRGDVIQPSNRAAAAKWGGIVLFPWGVLFGAIFLADGRF